MSSAPPPSAPPGSPWRNALEGALCVATAVVAMAAAAWAALTLLGAGAVAPVSRLAPMMVSMAVGGGVTVESVPSPESADGGGLGGGLGGLLGGLGGGGGMSLGLTGEAALTPLTLTFLGMAVLAIAFFRPLRRRQRPAPALLWARCGGALATTAVVFPAIAATAQGTARLPESVTERFGKGASSGALSRFTGGGGGGLSKGLSSVMFETDAVAAAFLGLLWVGAVLAVGCVAARRTTLPRPLALSRVRLKWNAVTSTLTGTAAVLCCSTLAVAVLAGAAALTGRDQAAKAAGLLLLAGPNLIAVLLTTGLGTSWEAGMHRLQSDGGGMLGMLGGGAQGDTAGTDRSVDLSGWSGAGMPLWLIAMVLMLLLLTTAGYVASARTPARTPREGSEALLDRHAEIALRMGIAVGITALTLPLAARGSVRIGITLMGNEMGGMTAGLDDGLGLSPLTGFVLAALAAYGGSRLQNRRARRRGRVAQPTSTATRRPAVARSTARVPSDSAS
ncbi:streptophobe family protein [Streptomyces sp. NBC_00893]|uniref:streptophobe family protein n=1 Tax=Streptomyces sp. NBC_00893 TaxID=2975862 RepID=UPI002255C274|nr:streptophobe family protein [Streptomyces sp. NBC_00893]MCX4851973.1 streptophobe family protein [Streptomyces sp. NBC_00893]